MSRSIEDRSDDGLSLKAQRKYVRECLDVLKGCLPCGAVVAQGRTLGHDSDWADAGCSKDGTRYTFRMQDLSLVDRADLERALIEFLVSHEYAHFRSWAVKRIAGLTDHGPHFGIEWGPAYSEVLGLQDRGETS